jgi:MFS family permease
MSPFYPLKAKEKGIDLIWVGVVMGVMAVAQILASFIIGKFLHKIGGRHIIILFGSLLIIAQTTMLGYLQFEDDRDQFLKISLIAQVLGGLGAGANSTASMAIMSSFASNEREKYIGWVEAAAGIGLLTGPLFGALLFNLGGYIMPFFTFGKQPLSLTLFLSHHLPCGVSLHPVHLVQGQISAVTSTCRGQR